MDVNQLSIDKAHWAPVNGETWELWYRPYGMDGAAFGKVETRIIGKPGAKWSVLPHNRWPAKGVKWSGEVDNVQHAQKVVQAMYYWACDEGPLPEEARA